MNIKPTLEQEIETRLNQCVTHYSTEYDRVAEHIRIVGGDQWTKEMRKGRGRNRLELKQNIIRPFVNRLVNPLRMNPLGGNVAGNTPITEPLKAKLRKIEGKSRASEVIEQGFEDAVMAGYGWIEVEIKQGRKGLELGYARPSLDPVSIMIDPESMSVDGSDSYFAFKLGYISDTRATADFGENDYTGTFDGFAGSQSDGMAQSLTYYRRVADKVEIKRYIGRVMVYESELPIEFIPIIPIYGDRYRRDDNRYYWTGIVQWMRDSQMLVNYYKSQEAERIGKAPKSQWLIEREQKADNEEQWSNPNRYDTLVWDRATTIDGTQLPPPQRLDNTSNTMDLQAPYQSAIADAGRVVGMPDAMFGIDPEQTGESGKAVLARQSHAEIATAQYMDNVKKSIEQATKIIISLIPLVYTQPETIEVSDPDGNVQTIDINWADPSIDWEAVDVDVQSGPAYASRRKEDANYLIETVKLIPQQAPMLMDLVLSQQDSAGAKAMAKRLRTMLPPELKDNQGVEQPDPQAMQALQAAQQATQSLEQENQAMREMISQLQSALIAEEAKAKSAVMIKQMEIDKDMSIAQQDNIVKVQIANINANAKATDTQMREDASTQRELLNLQVELRKDESDLEKQSMATIQETAKAINATMGQGLPTGTRGIAQGGLISNI